MSAPEELARALELSRSHDLLVSYTAAGWRISFSSDDPVATIPMADDDDFSGPRITQPHGTHAAHNRHRKRGEVPCARCSDAERLYQAARHRRRRAAMSADVDGAVERRSTPPDCLASVYHLPTTVWTAAPLSGVDVSVAP